MSKRKADYPLFRVSGPPPFQTIGLFTFLRTYARRHDENDPKSTIESWQECIERVVTSCNSQLKVGFTEDELQEVFSLLYNLKCSVAGRFMWQLGTRTVDNLGLPSLQNCAFSVIDDPVRPFTWAMDMLMLGCGVGYRLLPEDVAKLPVVKYSLVTRKDTKDADYIVPDSREGWVKVLGKVLKAHFYSGQNFTYSCTLLRSKGAPIKSFGGLASGPEVLCDGLEKISGILNKRVGQKIRSVDALDIMNIIGMIVVSGNVRRCLPKSSLVHTECGLIPIENVKSGMNVLTTDGYHCVKNTFVQGEQKLIKIITEDGEFKCTPNHKMPVLVSQSKYIWKEASTLETEDRLLTSRMITNGVVTSLPCWDGEITVPELDEDMGWFIGLFQGGNCYICLDVAEKAKTQLQRFGVGLDITIERNGEECYIVASNRELALYIENIKYSNTIPDFILQASPQIRLAYVSGLCDSNRGVSASASTIQVLSTVYESMAKGVQNLLYSCGIESRYNADSSELSRFYVNLITLRSQKEFSEIPTLMKSFGNIDSYDREEGKWCPVKVLKIIECDVEETFDIEVDTVHEFFCNGYLTHNSAQLAIGDCKDKEFLQAKDWSSGAIPNWRCYSNNSIVCNDINEIIDNEDFWKGYEGNGEPYGLINLKLSRSCGRLGDFQYPDPDVDGYNPCVTGDTMVLTSEGLREVSELVNKPFIAVVNGCEYKSLSSGFWKTGTKQIFKIILKNGLEIKATDNHKFYMETGNRIYDWKEVKELKENDRLILSNNERYKWKSGDGSFSEGYFIRQLIGDGITKEGKDQSIISMCIPNKIEIDKYGPAQNILHFIDSVIKPSEFQGFIIDCEVDNYKQYRMNIESFKNIGEKYGVYKGEKNVYEKGSYDFSRGLLQGFFDTDGDIQRDLLTGIFITLSQCDINRLQSIQRLLFAMGIYSTICDCKAPHKLIITKDSTFRFSEIIGFSDNYKSELLSSVISQYNRRRVKKFRFVSGISSITACGEEDVYDCTIDKVHCFSANCIIAHNCAEQSLNNFETCVSGDTRIHTGKGCPYIKDVVGEEVEIFNGQEWSLVRPFLAKADDVFLKITMNDGSELKVTTYHEFSVLGNLGNYLKLRADELKVGMQFPEFSLDIKKLSPFSWRRDNAFVLGIFLNCGHISSNGDDYELVIEIDVDKTELVCYSLKFFNKTEKSYDQKSFRCVVNTEQIVVPSDVWESFEDREKGLPTYVMNMDKQSITSFMEGIIKASCTILTDYYHIECKSEKKIRDLQILVRRIGINITQIRKNNISGTWFLMIPDFEIQNIHNLHIIHNRPLVQPPTNIYQQYITSIQYCDTQEASYCFSEPKRHMGVFGNVLTYQCCLSELYLPNIKTKEELYKCAQYMYRICKHSLSLPCVDSKETERVVHKNMRMGIGVTGYLQATEEQKGWLPDCYKFLREFDKKYSISNGFPSSIKLCTVKPSGTLSLLGGCTSGVHPGFSQYYRRRIRIASESQLLAIAKKNGYPVEYVKNFDGTLDYSTQIITFPYKLPLGTILAEHCTAIDQLEWVRRVQTDWSDNSVSVTVYYRKNELPQIKDWLRKNYNNSIKTVSFLLHSDHGFQQAPLEAMTLEEYEELAAQCKPITDMSGICFTDENIELLKEGECAGGVCPMR
jgi:ribonucleotide reductase, class II